MAAQRRKIEVFSLSFLDVICCGFGAVILLYTILSALSDPSTAAPNRELSAQVDRIDEEVREGRENLVRLRNTLEKTEAEITSASSRATRMLDTLKKNQDESSVYDAETLARRARIQKLQADVKALEEGNRRLEASARTETPRAERAGTGQAFQSRRYITGLALRGKRVLVLVDRSASMLDDDLVNVILLRNSSEAKKRTALKWRRTVDIVNWVAAQVPQGAQFQVYTFNTSWQPLIAGTNGKWLPGGEGAQLEAVAKAMDELVPQDGTSLINAFRAIRDVNPEPDQVVLITDGLPTQGASPPALRRFVDASARARFFDEAARALTLKAPVDVVLLPMKGDLPASHRFWMLARSTKGAFIMPSPDWP